MAQVYVPKYKKDLVKDEEGHTENDHENARKLESQSRVRIHQAFQKSDYYPHVMTIVEEWLNSMVKLTDFKPEDLVKVDAEELKELTMVAAKCRAEAEKLKKRLS